MTRRSREVGIIKSCVLGAALALALAMPAQAQNKLAFTGSALIGTDYMFRSISNTNQDPTAQVEFDATYGMFWAYIWGSNTAFADVELDYGAGISPKWKDITFSIGGLYYTFPGGSFQNYFELKTGATWAKGAWSIGVNNYWSPDNFQLYGESDAIEGAVGYTFASKLFNFFTPTLSGTLGFQSFDKVASDYTYWNAGLTLGFLDHWSADVRYYDTSYSKTECAQYFGVPGTRSDCDARVVGAIKATF
jgi:uncharacterized protein (TIGR02001 family)